MSAGIISSEKQTVFPECSLRKTVSFEEQIDPRTNIRAYFLSQVESVLFFIREISFEIDSVLKTGKHHSDIPQF